MSATYSLEFRREAVELLKRSGKSVPQLASELGVSPQSLRNWSRQIDIDEGKAAGLSSDEREELRRLRRENRTLIEEREILKKAVVFFAKDGGTRSRRSGSSPRRRPSTPSRRCAGCWACRARAFMPGSRASRRLASVTTSGYSSAFARSTTTIGRSMDRRASTPSCAWAMANGSAASASSG